jgi:hypothetical protein
MNEIRRELQHLMKQNLQEMGKEDKRRLSFLHGGPSGCARKEEKHGSEYLASFTASNTVSLDTGGARQEVNQASQLDKLRHISGAMLATAAVMTVTDVVSTCTVDRLATLKPTDDFCNESVYAVLSLQWAAMFYLMTRDSNFSSTPVHPAVASYISHAFSSASASFFNVSKEENVDQQLQKTREFIFTVVTSAKAVVWGLAASYAVNKNQNNTRHEGGKPHNPLLYPIIIVAALHALSPSLGIFAGTLAAGVMANKWFTHKTN